MVILTTNNLATQMSVFFKRAMLLIGLFALSNQSNGQRYSNYFSENQPSINWQNIKDTVAPNLPDYFLSEPNVESKEYKEEVVAWIYSNPIEFDKARMVDFRFNEYVGWALKADGKSKDEGPFGNPAFVYFPVNENRPVFVDTKNPDQDSLVFSFKTQNWYLNYHPSEYEALYGELPEIIPYPPLIKHPNDFPEGHDRSSIEWYYPEFSSDPKVFQQYQKLYDVQFGSTKDLKRK